MSRQARLVYQTPAGVDSEIPVLEAGETSIGRHPACSLTISLPSVSRKHARLWFDGSVFMIEDLGSSNGTYLNNQRITRSPVADGATVRCGDFQLTFYTSGASGSVNESRASGGVNESRATRSHSQVPSAKPRVVGTIRPSHRSLRGALNAAPSASSAPSIPPPLPEDADDELHRLQLEVEHWKAQAEGQALITGGASPSEAEASLDSTRTELSENRKALALAKSKVEALNERLAAAGDEREGLEQASSEQDAELNHRDARIEELESAVARSEEQIRTGTDRQLHLQGEIREQQEQLERYRAERDEGVQKLIESEERCQTLGGAQDASSRHENQLTEAVNDLKREVRQHEKALREQERELELVKYDLGASQRELENLRLALSEEERNRKKLNTTVDDLRQLLSEKEAMIDGLQVQVERWKARTQQAEARAQEEGGVQLTRLTEALAIAQAERDAMERRVTETTRSYEALEARQQSPTDSRHHQEQLNELKRANRDLRNELEAARHAAAGHNPAQLESVEAQLESALVERDQAQMALQRLQAAPAPVAIPAPVAMAPAPSSGDLDALLSAAIKSYEALNDLASDLRMNVEMAGGLVVDLRPLVEYIARLPSGAIDAQAMTLVKEADALYAIEAAHDSLENAQAGSNNFKQTMRSFRQALARHGYGS